MFFYSSWLRYFSVSSKTSIHCVDFLISLSCLLLLVHLGIKIGHILSKMRKSRKGENNSIFVVIIKMLVYDCNNWNHVKGKYLTNETDCFLIKCRWTTHYLDRAMRLSWFRVDHLHVYDQWLQRCILSVDWLF